MTNESVAVDRDDVVLIILGRSRTGKRFRPSDWAERLAGVMSQFGPMGTACISPFCYSPWCSPSHFDGVSCVVLKPQLKQEHPEAWDFCLNFAKDNGLEALWRPGSVLDTQSRTGARERSPSL
jgi:hypothetical protein